MRISAAVLAAVVLYSPAASASIFFQDTFNIPGTHLDYSKWTTEIGPTSYIPRTQLADWVTPGGVGVFNVDASGAQLKLDTFNPTGFSLYGTQAKSIQYFQPQSDTLIQFNTQLQLGSLQKGLVYGMYFYGCNPSPCPTQHDEIDIELLTNLLQPGSTPKVHLNLYANEPQGVGHPVVIDLPSFDPLAQHDWTIQWSPFMVWFLVDHMMIYATNAHVPQGPMQVAEIAWGPDSSWPLAYDASLQPAATAGANQSFSASLRSVTVNDIPRLPEPATWVSMITGLAVIAGARHLSARAKASHEAADSRSSEETH